MITDRAKYWGTGRGILGCHYGGIYFLSSDVSEFFSNKQLNAPSSQNESFSIFYFNGRPLFGMSACNHEY